MSREIPKKKVNQDISIEEIQRDKEENRAPSLDPMDFEGRISKKVEVVEQLLMTAQKLIQILQDTHGQKRYASG